MSDKLCFKPATELAKAIRDGKISPVAVVDAFLDQINARNDATNAYVTVLEADAREAAKEAERAVERGDDLGPLHGLPVAIKDLTAVEGVRLTFGAKPLAENVATEDAVVVSRLKEAGAIVLGKTNTPEFGLKTKTENRLFGTTSTPFDLDRNAGGSSGGSAAAVADGLAPFAEGSDAGGSVRIPSAFCGVFGMKPSFGRIAKPSRPNAFGTHTPMTHEGVHARYVADAALALDVMAGPDPRDPFSLPQDDIDYLAATDRDASGFTVAYSPDLGVFPIHSDVEAGVEAGVDGLREADMTVEEVEVDPRHTLDEIVHDASMTQWDIQAAELAENLADTFSVDVTGVDRDDLPGAMIEMVERGREHGALAYRLADRVRTDVYDAVADVFEDYDLLVCPVTTVPPFSNHILGPSEVNGVPVDPLSGWFLTFFFNLTGHPAASVPAGLTDDGLPVGMQVVGRRFADDDVFAASAAFERVRPWHDDYPSN